MEAPTQAQRRWFHLTLGRFVIGLLAVEVLLWLSDRFGWLGWHKGYAVLTGVAVMGVGLLMMAVWLAVAVVLRRRFQCGHRTLVMLVIVLALPCGWLGASMRNALTQRSIANFIQSSGGRCYDTEHELLRPFRPRGDEDSAWLPVWIRYDFFHSVSCVDYSCDSRAWLIGSTHVFLSMMPVLQSHCRKSQDCLICVSLALPAGMWTTPV